MDFTAHETLPCFCVILNSENVVLKELLKQANDKTKNSYEIYWLNYKLKNNQAKLEAQ
jgi:hypothetical protein